MTGWEVQGPGELAAYRLALFNYATRTAAGFVDFDWFRVSDTEKAG
jgi:hypothetical protein